MKLTASAALLLLLAALGTGSATATRRGSSSGRVAAAAAGFGPGGCVSLQRSAPPPQGKGSCVLRLDCEGRDISQVEFTFDCESAADGGIVRHSFGRGGFDPNEEFDTDVQCDRCLPLPESEEQLQESPQHSPAHLDQQRAPLKPLPALHHLASWHVGDDEPKPRNSSTSLPLMVDKETKQMRRKNGSSEMLPTPTKTEKVEPPSQHEEQDEAGGDRGGSRRANDDSAEQREAAVVRYGPDQCVSTYRSGSSGHCIMETHCSAEAIKNYSFGLVCVDKVGVPVRHLFGKNSFDPVETFDTLIACHQCLGLEDIPDSVAMNSQVLALAREIHGLEGTLHGLAQDVSRLDAQAAQATQRAGDQANTAPEPPARTGDEDAAAPEPPAGGGARVAPPAGVAPPPVQEAGPSPAPPPPAATSPSSATALFRGPGGRLLRRRRPRTAWIRRGAPSFSHRGVPQGEEVERRHRHAARLVALAAEVEREAEAEEDGEEGEGEVEEQPSSNDNEGAGNGQEEGEVDEAGGAA